MQVSWKKKISLFLTSQALSLFGSSLVQYAIIWYITLQTESGMMMTWATLCGFIPQVFISLFAGVWADRYNKKVLIMLADGMIAFATLIIILFFVLGKGSISLLFVVLAIRSLGSGIQAPTVTSFLPEIVPEEQLMRINGINTTLQSIMLILSPAVSGALLATVPLPVIFSIDIVTALLGIGIFAFVPVVSKVKKQVKNAYFTSIKEGINYTKNQPVLCRLFFYLFLSNVIVAPLAILTPLLVTRTYGASPFYLTLNEVIFFVGNILGGILISTWGGFKDRIRTIALGCFLCGLFAIGMGFTFSFVFYLIMMGLMGVTMPMFNTPFITIFQEQVDSDKQGRVFSLISIVGSAVIPLSMIVYGPLADAIKMEWIFVFVGIVFMIGAIFLAKDKVIKEENQKKKSEEEISL